MHEDEISLNGSIGGCVVAVNIIYIHIYIYIESPAGTSALVTGTSSAGGGDIALRGNVV